MLIHTHTQSAICYVDGNKWAERVMKIHLTHLNTNIYCVLCNENPFVCDFNMNLLIVSPTRAKKLFLLLYSSLHLSPSFNSYLDIVDLCLYLQNLLLLLLFQDDDNSSVPPISCRCCTLSTSLRIKFHLFSFIST